MVFGKFISEEADQLASEDILNQVFAEELKMPGYLADQPELVMRALAFDKEIPVGTGSIIYDGDNFRIQAAAVLPEYRGQMYGDFLVRLLVDKAMMANAQEIELEALSGTEPFFEKIGFKVSGAAYDKYGSSWVPMQLMTSQIHKCCNCGH